MNQTASQAAMPASRAAGIVIAASTILSILFVAFDEGASGHGKAEILASMVSLRHPHQLVHLVAALCLTGFGFGFAALAQRAGLRRPPVLAALLCYLTGCLAMLSGVLIDGFISVDLALKYAGAAPDELAIGYQLVQFCYVVLQNLASLSWVMQALGVLFMGAALLADGGARRKLGMVGLLGGAAPIVAIAAGYPNMDQTLVLGIMLAQAVWHLSSAVFLIRAETAAPAWGRMAAA